MADSQYAAYCQEFGYPPKQANHLIAFARNRGATVSWRDANSVVNKTQDTEKKTNDRSPKATKVTKPNTPKSTKHRTPSTPKRNSNGRDPSIHYYGSQWYQYAITQLTSMGWDEDQSLKAIMAANGNLQLAIESLMSGEIQKYEEKAAKPLPQTSPAFEPPLAVAKPFHVSSNKTEPTGAAQSVSEALDKLSSGHASIKQRLSAMHTLYDSLDIAIASDLNGQRLLSVFAQQLLHEDYIYREYAVRIKALEQISDVFVFCLQRVDGNESAQVLNIEESMSDILNYLFLLLDDSRAKRFHEMVRQTVGNIVDAVIGQKHTNITIDLCGMLNEKGNCENITQSRARAFALQEIFEKVVFGFDKQVVRHMFNINTNGWSNKLVNYTNAVAHDEHGLPQNSEWLRLVIADEWDNDEEETFKDIIADCVSVMIMDPNGDIGIIGFNLAVYLYGYNNGFAQHLEAEAKYRFLNYLSPKHEKSTETVEPIEITEHEMEHSTSSPMNQESPMSVSSYRINQITPISVASPTLPDL